MGWATEKFPQTEMSGLSNFLPKAYGVEGWEPLSSTVKWPMHEADNSFPSSAQVNNAWNCTSTSACISGF